MSRITIPWKTYMHYKKHLNPQDSALYDALLNGLLEWKRTITIPSVRDANHVYNVFLMVLRDVPMLFHVSNALSIRTGLVCSVEPQYIMDERKYHQYFSAVVSFLKNCQKLLEKHATFNKLQIIHDSVVKHVEYHDTETFHEHNVLGTIIDRKAVCESIAKSYKLLCDYNRIPAIVVFGYSDANNQSIQRSGFSVSSTKPEDNHAWNKVKLDGTWYNVDLTFDVTLGELGGVTIYRYDYFLRSDSIFNAEHHASDLQYLPSCVSDFNLYSKIDRCVKTLGEIAAMVRGAILANKKSISFSVDPGSGLSQEIIANEVASVCYRSGRIPLSYSYHELTGVFCATVQ